MTRHQCQSIIDRSQCCGAGRTARKARKHVDATTHESETTVVTPEEATEITSFGSPVTITLRSENTGGQSALLEFRLAPGPHGPAPHSHATFDELYHVLAGAVLVLVNGEQRRVAAGSSVFVPRGTVHTLSNPYDAPAHFLYLVSPAGFERYFEDFAAASTVAGGPVPPAVAAEITSRYDVIPANSD